MSHALPHYLTRTPGDFNDCPPGHRFGLYFDGWEPGWCKPTNKTPAFRTVASTLPGHSRAALDALCQRQRALAANLGQTVFTHPALLSAPLATGLGNEHPLENGFAFLTPHGLPYLAGSGMKGVIRRAAEELASGDWGDSAWTQDSINTLFGLETDPGDTQATHTRGALVFWDLFFQPPAGSNRPLLTVEIMTPHHSGYLQGKGTPHANESPTPIPFLAIAAGSTCTAYVQCTPALIRAESAALHDTWPALLAEAFEHAGEWLGFGAKSAVGYGRLQPDPVEAARKKQEKQRQEAAAKQEKQQQEAAAKLASLPADERFLAELTQHMLDTLPSDPRTGTCIVQPTSGKEWAPTLAFLDARLDTLTGLEAAQREKLASEVKKSLNAHFKVTGKAEKTMKERLAAIRSGGT